MAFGDNVTSYGDISPRTAAFAAKELLNRGLPFLVLEKFGQMNPLPLNSSRAMTFRRYKALATATAPLTEGVTPAGKKLEKEDVSITLSQYGDLVEITDVIEDTHEDDILRESVGMLGEQAAQTIEAIRYNVLKAGTNKFYSNGAVRTDINTPMTLSIQKKAVRALKRQNASKITNVVKSTPDYGTRAVLPSFVAVGHTDLENDIRAMTGFIDVKDYGGGAEPFEGEIGAVGDVRYILSNIFTSYANGGGAKLGMVSTGGMNADVYPIIIMGRNAWAGVALKGRFAVTPMVINPNKPSKSDPLGQRGTVAWKTMQGAVILNDAWMAVVECAASDLE